MIINAVAPRPDGSCEDSELILTGEEKAFD